MEEARQATVGISYDVLNEHFTKTKKPLDFEGYQACLIPGNDEFIAFSKKGAPPKECSAEGKIFKQYGLKFHIGLSEWDRDMYRRGWDVLIAAFIHHKLENFKVIRSYSKMSDTPGQEGKDVTIYADADPGRTIDQWKAILEDITNRLLEAKISPGYRALGTREKPEKPVNGSNYITYRYYDEWSKKSVWPEQDPCQKINVVPIHLQPDIPTLDRQKSHKNVEKLSKHM